MSQPLQPTPEVLQKARSIKLLLLDVDGVLTEGGLHYSDQGEQTKTFNTLDGHGLKLLQAHGISVAIISGRDSLALRKRLADLGINHVFAGVHDKKAAAQELLTKLGLQWSQVAAMGGRLAGLGHVDARRSFSCTSPSPRRDFVSRRLGRSSRWRPRRGA
jgi:3-deoxy-D-manno-octulosonate 8-phosphate phosphatase (KDO 8-P phosphatase)